MADWHVPEELMGRFLRAEATRGESQRIVRHLLSGCPQCFERTHRAISEIGLWSSRKAGWEEAYEEVFQRALAFATEEEQRLALERLRGWEQWSSLEPLTPQTRFTVVEADKSFHTWGFYDRLLEASRWFMRTEPVEAVEVVRLAITVAERLDPAALGEKRIADLLARAWAPICALGLISWLQDGHVIVVKHLASSHDAGAWVAASVAAKAIMWVAIGLASYLVPETARHAGQGEDPRPILLRTMGLIGALAVPMVLIYSVAAKVVLEKVMHVHGGESALPLLGAAMALLALSYLSAQFHLGLHKSRFIVALAVAGVAQPLVLIAIGAQLATLALGMFCVQAALAATMVTLALRQRPRAVATDEEAVAEEPVLTEVV